MRKTNSPRSLFILSSLFIACASNQAQVQPQAQKLSKKPVPVSERVPLEEVLKNRPRNFVISAEPPAWVHSTEPWVYKNSLFAVGRARGSDRMNLAQGAAKMAARAAIAERMETFVQKLEQHYEASAKASEVSDGQTRQSASQTLERNRRTETFTAGTLKDVVIRKVWHDGVDQWAAIAELRDPQENFIGATKDRKMHKFLETDPQPLVVLIDKIRSTRPIVILEVW